MSINVILLVLGGCFLLLGLIFGVILDKEYIFSIGLLVFFIFGMIADNNKPFIVEYQTSKYELSYKYVIHDNATDTIIVIKEKQ